MISLSMVLSCSFPYLPLVSSCSLSVWSMAASAIDEAHAARLGAAIVEEGFLHGQQLQSQNIVHGLFAASVW